MALSRTTEAYIGFIKISDKSYAEKIRFFEDHASEFRVLPEEEKLELHLLYVMALFEVGAYDKFLKRVDTLIEVVFEENIVKIKGEDIAQKLLFKKACSLYHIGKLQKSKRVGVEVYRMYPDQEQHKILLRNIFYKEQLGRVQNVRAFSIGLYMFSALIIAIQLFLVDPFYAAQSDLIKVIWQSIFGFSSLVLVVSEIYIRVIASKMTRGVLDRN